MVQPGGVEPPTYRSVVCRSIQLSYGCTRRLPSCGRRIVEHPAVPCKPPSFSVPERPGTGREERSPGVFGRSKGAEERSQSVWERSKTGEERSQTDDERSQRGWECSKTVWERSKTRGEHSKTVCERSKTGEERSQREGDRSQSRERRWAGRDGPPPPPLPVRRLSMNMYCQVATRSFSSD